MPHPLLSLPKAHATGRRPGITSVCSAHPVVIEAALLLARHAGTDALIEATCNQVNQDGGYTGMTPADFRRFVERIAERIGLLPNRIILGGDHLGPNPWKDLPADEAMAKAEVMIADFAAAGFTKLHLDTSMGCKGEPVALSDDVTAARAACLAARAEAACGAQKPVYIIGTEVPVPGGAVDGLDHLQITTPDAVATTHQVHRDAFAALGLDDAFARVIALVVQPGVEFGHDDVIAFAPDKARDLSQTLRKHPALIFEAHSTDYQTEQALTDLVGMGFAILKVGPWLTFALREALYALDAIADVLDGMLPANSLFHSMEALMLARPGHWQKYYHGDAAQLFRQRHFSYSDRIRYYWPEREAADATARLMSRLGDRPIPLPLVSQYLPHLLDWATASKPAPDTAAILIESVQVVLRRYAAACTSGA